MIMHLAIAHAALVASARDSNAAQIHALQVCTPAWRYRVVSPGSMVFAQGLNRWLS